MHSLWIAQRLSRKWFPPPKKRAVRCGTAMFPYISHFTLSAIINPRRACAARVTVVVLCVCMCVCVYVCMCVCVWSSSGVLALFPPRNKLLCWFEAYSYVFTAQTTGLWKTACDSLAQTRETAQIYGSRILLPRLLAHIRNINRRLIHN